MQPQGSWGCARGGAPEVLLEHDQQLLLRVHLARAKGISGGVGLDTPYEWGEQ